MGDSGGPLTVAEDLQTLIGVVSGGVGCGDGIPGWYTKVSYYIDWIRCIIDKSVEFDNNQKKVVEACKDTIKPEPTCVMEKNLVVEVDVFKQIKGRKYELCENLSNDDFDLDLREDKPVN